MCRGSGIDILQRGPASAVDSSPEETSDETKSIAGRGYRYKYPSFGLGYSLDGVLVGVPVCSFSTMQSTYLVSQYNGELEALLWSYHFRVLLDRGSHQYLTRIQSWYIVTNGTFIPIWVHPPAELISLLAQGPSKLPILAQFLYK